MKILRFIFVFLFFVILGFGFSSCKNFNSDMMNAFFNSSNADMLLKLSRKNASKLHVIFEANNLEVAIASKNEFEKKVPSDRFLTYGGSEDEIISFYEKYSQNLLSNDDYKLLVNSRYDVVLGNSLENLYNPFGIYLVPINNDPFCLFTNYVKSLGSDNFIDESESKSYAVLDLTVRENIATSPSVLNGEIKNLMNISVSNPNVNIYYVGTPIHSYMASSKSIKEINIICIISSLFVFGLLFYYFRSIKIILMILSSLVIGILVGFCMTCITFKSIHVLTFVFSTTLIGICVDYSLHFIMDKNSIKSITIGLLTTVLSLLVLLFSGINLMEQVSIFTSFGLISVYLYVLLFYPLFKVDFCKNLFNFSINKAFIYIFIAVILFGSCRMKFNDNIKNMYKPSKDMLKAEKLYSQLNNTNSNMSFIVVNGKNVEDILQKEEAISLRLKNPYVALSKFLPSLARQKKNVELKKKLYSKNLKNIERVIGKTKIQWNNNYITSDVIGRYPQLSEFFLDKNSTVMIVNDKIDLPEYAKLYNPVDDISFMLKNLRVKCSYILILVFGLLICMLSFIFSFSSALKIIFPPIIGILFALSFVGNINLFHILSVFLILGFGLDYSVFRFSANKNSNDAVFISAITTIFSFLMLSFTEFQQISSIGLMLFLGLLATYISSLILINKDR